MSAVTITPPGSTVGIVGGGQLGRMLAVAASRMGYRTHIFTPERDSPASHVATTTTAAAYDDAVALRAFAQSVDVITFEFESVPAEVLETLDGITAVRPKPSVLFTTRNRLREKQFIRAQGIATAPFAGVANASDFDLHRTCTLAQNLAHFRVDREKVFINQQLTVAASDLKSAILERGYTGSIPVPGTRPMPPTPCSHLCFRHHRCKA